MAPILTYEHKFWKTFIKLYESHPALWKCGSDLYKNRRKKQQGYLELVEMMREIEPTANIDTVKKKINSLRSCYRRKRRKMKEARRLGMDERKWAYYDYFYFLEGCKDPLEEDDDWRYCDDTGIDKFEETSLQSTIDESEAMIDDFAKQVECSPSSSPSDESKSNYEEDNTKYPWSVAARQTFWIEFIKLYGSKPELWKYGSDVFKDRELKKYAYETLVEKMREVEPNADVDMVKRKINSFRSIYRRILNKTKRAMRFGKKSYNSWVYFDYFSFLHENSNTFEDEDNSFEERTFIQLDSTNANHIEHNDAEEVLKHHVDEEDYIEKKYMQPKDNSLKRFRPPSPDESPKRNCSESLDIAHKQSKTNDEADILGIGWAYQYRSLSSSQKLFAKKAIDDILFEARLETLHRHSVKINESLCEKSKS